MSSILEKIKYAVGEGKYYEAQQLYKGLNSRYVSQKKMDKSVSLLLGGIKLMLDNNKPELALELSLCILETFKKCGEDCTFTEPRWPLSKSSSANSIELIHKIATSFADKYEHKIEFLKETINWSSIIIPQKKNSSFTQGEPSLHKCLAQTYWKIGNYAKSHREFSLSDEYIEHSCMLLEWSGKGRDEEYDLYIARAVLQLLCMAKIEHAKSIFTHYLKKKQETSPESGSTPLIHFIQFLFISIEKKLYDMYQFLTKTYSSELDRDPLLTKYLKPLPQTYFGVRTTDNSLQGMLNQMMQSLLG